MLRETAKQKLENLFKENEELFNNTIEEIDSWDGFLGDDRYFFMEDLDDEVTEIIDAIGEEEEEETEE